ncbi:MAG: hypothetical protein AAGI69_11705 [Cyanobacteria bacterium P01_H01_bin.21]
MFHESTQGASSTHPELLPEYEYEFGRHMVFGSLSFVQAIIKLLHKLNYAEPNDWSRPLPTGQPNEVMVILTKKVRVS